MDKYHFLLITSLAEQHLATVKVDGHAYCPRGSYYFLPGKHDTETVIKTLSHYERVISMERKRYDNVLKGLEYWKARAEEL